MARTRRSRSLRLASVVLMLAVTGAAAQDAPRAPLPMPRTWLQGYVKTVAGDWIVYPWAYPGQTRTLLSRTTDGRMRVAWTADPVPGGLSTEPITYLWHAGTASGYGAHAFTFAVNGRTVATFRSGRTASDREWSVAGADGATLSFKTTRVGTFDELFGFMWITAPRSVFGAGSPEFSVVGEPAGSQDYYLGPQEPVREFIRVRDEEAVFAGGERAIRVEVSSTRDPGTIVVEAGGAPIEVVTVPGYRTVLLPAGANTARGLTVRIRAGGAEVLRTTLTLGRVTPRTFWLLPHSHVDIGYSDPQPQVERKQWKNLRDAVELGLKTAAYPVEARFRWNVEGLWSVESYLAQAGADERQAFIAAVRQGTISLQANYTNILTGLATPEELRRWTDGARRLRAAYGLGPMPTAMHTDIPGLSWTTVAALAQSGVRYFSSGPNYMPGLPDGGDRIGATLKALGDRPFWWASPSGEERVLFWMAGRGYSWFHGLNMGRLSAGSRDDVLAYAKSLTDAGYPYDMVQVRYTIGGDNGPVDPGLSDAVKAWNETFATPRLVIATADAMFAEFERKYGDRLPVYSGDMTPYWEDGALSSAAEEILARGSARRLAQAEALWALRNPAAYPAQQAAEAWRNVILWHEHTWGAADSISQPDRPDVVAQWDYKRAFAQNAEVQSRALLAGAAPRPGSDVEIANTLGWARSGVVFIPADQSKAGDRVRTAEGRGLPSQRLNDGRLAVWVDSVPAMSSIRLRVTAGAPDAPSAQVRVEAGRLDTGPLRLEIDPSTGGITRLTWRTPGGEDLVLNAGLLGQYFYVPGRDPGAAVSRAGARLTVVERGPLVSLLRVEGPAPGTEWLRHTVQAVAGSDELGLTVEMNKAPVRAKESAHLAFPFSVPEGVIRFDLGEAVVRPDQTVLPGSNQDFFGAHSVVDVSGRTYGVSLATLDAPLIEPGGMTDERQNDRGTRNWRDRVAGGTALYAYLLNNYWHTNYKAEQSGLLSYRFVLKPHGTFDESALRRFSDEQDQPLLVFPVDPEAPPLRRPFTIDSTAVVASSLSPTDDGRAIRVRLYNPGNTPARVVITPATAGMRLSLVRGETGVREPTDGSLTLRPHATVTVVVESASPAAR